MSGSDILRKTNASLAILYDEMDSLAYEVKATMKKD